MPRRGSGAAASFFKSWTDINRFFHFVLNLVGHVEHVAKTAHDTLVKVQDDEAEKQKMIDDWKNRKSPLDELKKSRQFFLEVLYVRHIENFLAYLSTLLFEIFTQRPETLRSSDRVERGGPIG